MIRFSTGHRDRSMLVIVSYENVPMPRGIAFALRHIQSHGAPVDIHSCDRRNHVIALHNKTFGTHLHAQQWLIDAHRRDPVHFAPANSVITTSHCRRSDGHWVYVRSNGQHACAGELIPWYQTGIDLDDSGRTEHPDHFMAVGKRLGYKLVQPYKSGSERHHVVFAESPVPVLERWNQIAKERH